MSLSTLESLPNEILIKILDKYVDGKDVLVNFHGQLNTRFDAIIGQCRRFHFNFQDIRKDDFLTCINRLSQYADRIQALSLSECYTPNATNVFLSIFSSFDQFRNLRTLYICFDAYITDYDTVSAVVQSLSNTSIHSLSIILQNVWPGQMWRNSQRWYVC